MKAYNLTEKDKELIKRALETAKRGFRNDNLSCDVGCALVTESDKVYSGINIEIKSSAPTSICGEMGAIAQMVTNREKKINAIVAVWISKFKNKWGILPPCGACRHIISEFGNPFVIISKTKKVKLSELYPLPIK